MRDSNIIKNIVFDLGGVVLRKNPISILDKFDVSREDYEELSRFFADGKRLDLGEQTLEEKLAECKHSFRYKLPRRD